MTDGDIGVLEEAMDDVTYLISNGSTPTSAIAKVASAAELNKHQTNLLIYAYTNGMAAEKRGSIGGPLQRLGAFDLPDVQEVHRLVYGEPPTDKSAGLYGNDLFYAPDTLGGYKAASIDRDVLPYGLASFDIDVRQHDPDVIRELFGYTAKTASERDKEEGIKPSGITISKTTISIGKIPTKENTPEKDDGFYHKIPSSIEEMMECGFRPISVDAIEDLISTLTKQVSSKHAAWIAANAEADDEYRRIPVKLAELGRELNHIQISPQYKAAGLASVRAIYPEVADMLLPFITDINGYLIKDAGITASDISIKHDWVSKAADIYEQLKKVAELNLAAQHCAEEYQTICELYADVHKRIAVQEKTAGVLPFAMGMGTAKFVNMDSVLSDTSGDLYRKERAKLLDRADNRLSKIEREDIGVLSNINDFSTNDEILSAYPREELVRNYVELLQIAPTAMRRKATARAMLQQKMTQGRFAPTELVPALQLNKLDAHKSTLSGFESSDKGKDDMGALKL
jgi:hypothetical protein